jgi:hypothetical protein
MVINSGGLGGTCNKHPEIKTSSTILEISREDTIGHGLNGRRISKWILEEQGYV